MSAPEQELPSSAAPAGAATHLPFDTSVAHPARRYDYWLGGKDNFAADRASGDAVASMFPTIRLATIENRHFLARCVDFLVREAGIDQFLDLGTGIPTANNTHEVAQRANPTARVVYVDNDPIVLAHARALLTSHPEGATAYIDADVRDPQTILNDPALAATLDLSRPIALTMLAVLHFLYDHDDPEGVVRQLTDALPAGSYLVISHATHDWISDEERAGWTHPAQQRALADFRFRSRDEVARFFAGHELVEPGIVPISEWRRPAHEMAPEAAKVSIWGGVARLNRP